MKIELECGDGLSTFLWLRQKHENGKTRSAVFVVSKSKIKTKNSNSVKLPGKLPDGNWKFSYRYGKWQIEFPEQSHKLIGYAGAGFKGFLCTRLSVTANMSTAAKDPEVTLGKWVCTGIDIEFTPDLFPDPNREDVKKIKTAFNNAATTFRAGNPAKALSEMRKIIRDSIKIFGKYHPEILLYRSNFGVLNKIVGNPDPKSYLRVRDDAIKVFGADHYEISAYESQLGGIYLAMGEFEASKQSLLKAISIKQNTGSGDDITVVRLRRDVAEVLKVVGDFDQAEKIVREMLAVLNEDENLLLCSIGNMTLADTLALRGDRKEAAKYAERSVVLMKKAVGENHFEYGKILNGYAETLIHNKEPQKAQKVLEECVEVLKDTVGEKSLYYAVALHNLSFVFADLDQIEKSLECSSEALAIVRSTVGERHPLFANAAEKTGMALLAMGDIERATPYLEKCLHVRQLCFGDRHYHIASGHLNLAQLYLKQGKVDEALEQAKKSEAMHIDLFGADNLLVYFCKKRIGDILIFKGELDTALSYASDYAAKTIEYAGKESSEHSYAQLNLGKIHMLRGDFSTAEEILRSVAQIEKKLVRKNMFGKAEWQLDRLRSEGKEGLDYYLSSCLNRKVDSKQLYQVCFDWKGIVELQKKHIAQQVSNSENSEYLERIDELTTKISNLLNEPPSPPQNLSLRKSKQVYETKLKHWRSELSRLQGLKNELDQKLNVSKTKDSEVTVDQLLSALPEDTALLDYVRYQAFIPDQDHKGRFRKEHRYICFVADSNGVNHFDLDPAKLLDESATAWATAIYEGQPEQVVRKLGARLKSLCFSPLLKFTGNKKQILISPDGMIEKLPFDALPGKDTSKYLIENYVFSVIPTPKTLIGMKKSEDSNTLENVLLVGDVSFGKANNSKKDSESWPSLPGSKLEVQSIESILKDEANKRSIQKLTGAAATPKAFMDLLPQQNVVHVATHGFFRENQMLKSQFSAYAMGHGFGRSSFDADFFTISPGIQTGLVFAPENKNQSGQNSSVVTAEQLGYLDLSGVEIIVLSACQTAVGDRLLSSPIISLQRSLQMAGAKSSVTALWKVEDMATQQLMVRFYHNLIEKKLPRSQALREAKLWLLTDNAAIDRIEQNRGEPIQVDKSKIIRRTQAVESKTRCHPKYWAAFMLSGDWQ